MGVVIYNVKQNVENYLTLLNLSKLQFAVLLARLIFQSRLKDNLSSISEQNTIFISRNCVCIATSLQIKGLAFLLYIHLHFAVICDCGIHCPYQFRLYKSLDSDDMFC